MRRKDWPRKSGLGLGLGTGVGGGGMVYFLLDNFNTTPEVGSRTVVDSETKYSISGGVLTSSGGLAVVPAWADPRLSYDAVTRESGISLKTEITTAFTNKFGPMVGFTKTLATATAASDFVFQNSATAGQVQTAAIAKNVYSYAAATSYMLLSNLRTKGHFMFIKGGTYTNWTLIHIDEIDVTSTLYPSIINYNGVFTSNYIKGISLPKFAPNPLLSDGFTGTGYNTYTFSDYFDRSNELPISSPWTNKCGSFCIIGGRFMDILLLILEVAVGIWQ